MLHVELDSIVGDFMRRTLYFLESDDSCAEIDHDGFAIANHALHEPQAAYREAPYHYIEAIGLMVRALQPAEHLLHQPPADPSVSQDGIPKRVLMKNLIGSRRVVDELSGEILPRIC